MNKYISPAIKIEEIEAADVILASSDVNTAGYEVKSLDGIDTGDDKSAVFSALRWF